MEIQFVQSINIFICDTPINHMEELRKILENMACYDYLDMDTKSEKMIIDRTAKQLEALILRVTDEIDMELEEHYVKIGVTRKFMETIGNYRSNFFYKLKQRIKRDELLSK